MIRTKILLAAAALVTQLILVAPALAADDGEGLAGETNDKVITFFALGVILFFTLVVILGSAIQNALQKRKDARMEAHRRGRHGW
ncbi:MAG TPA: hypothetical protein VF715_11205 [Thermoleophilaceae bacterium]|jgi:nitrogen fixation/metabolism regulation signal transduction histidine kinase